MRRRDFITLLGGAAAAWPLATHGQLSGTGLSAFNVDIVGKRVELLREVVPSDPPLTDDSQIGANLRVCADEENRANIDQRS